MGSRVGGSGPFERFYRSRTTFALHYNGYSLGSARRDIVLWVTRTIRRRSRVLTRKTLQCGPDEKLEGIKALRRRVRAKNLLTSRRTSRRIQYIPRQPSVMESKISKFHALLNTAVRQLPIKKFAHKAAVVGDDGVSTGLVLTAPHMAAEWGAVRTRPVLTPSSPTTAALWANFLMGS